MQTIKVETKKTYTVVMTSEEFNWLKAIMQNPFFPYKDISDEPKLEKEMRKKFWDGLNCPIMNASDKPKLKCTPYKHEKAFASPIEPLGKLFQCPRAPIAPMEV